MRTIPTTTVILAAMLALAGCSTPVKLDEKVPVEDRSASKVDPNAGAVDPRTVAPVTATTMDPLNDPQGVLAKRSVYFDYDSYIIKDEFRPIVESHAKYLNENKGRRIIIQGNTDQRGGAEYNLALGQKRAEALRRAFSLLGVGENQMEAVSLGKEKPKATGNDEAAYAENRRADIVYQ